MPWRPRSISGSWAGRCSTPRWSDSPPACSAPAFFAALEYTQTFLLERVAGYAPLRAHGEKILGESGPLVLHPLVIMILPAAGALLAGLVCLVAPETRGGGGDAMIHAFHHQGGVVRRRVIWVKALASILTLGSGGSGGREGPTMQMGGAIGSTIGRLLNVSSRERRILMLAGVAAGMAAVFRTPLGAALLAAEVLYRDDFEAEALVPAVLASVISYSVVISIFGESTLFARARTLSLHPAPPPALRAARGADRGRGVAVPGHPARRPEGLGPPPASRLGPPRDRRARARAPWRCRSSWSSGARIGTPGKALGILGGGYGAAQIAITGRTGCRRDGRAPSCLLFLCGAKLIATSFTIGTGGSAGDFGPSLVLGGLFGGAFGRAAAALLHDPSIDPGAFALVGMGTFYGGLAHVPVSSLIMVCELAGSYDLLVPLMLAEGIAFVALRKRSLYEAQVPTHNDSPVHRPADSLEPLARQRVADVLVARLPFSVFEATTDLDRCGGPSRKRPGRPLFRSSLPKHRYSEHWWSAWSTRPRSALLSPDNRVHAEARAVDLSQPPVTLALDDDLRKAAELLLNSGFRQLPVIGPGGEIAGFIEEPQVTRVYLNLSEKRA